MVRPQSQILSDDDASNAWFVVHWLSRRFSQEELNPTHCSVMTAPVGQALDRNVDVATLETVHLQVRESWRHLQADWAKGWELEYDNRLPNADAYFTDLVVRTNHWLDQHFPANEPGVDAERRRLLAAVRQQRLRDVRKSRPQPGPLNVQIGGELQKMLGHSVPTARRAEFVRTALGLVLGDAALIEKTFATMSKTMTESDNELAGKTN